MRSVGAMEVRGDGASPITFVGDPTLVAAGLVVVVRGAGAVAGPLLVGGTDPWTGVRSG